MSIRIDREACVGCGLCREVCPGNLIRADAQGRAYLKRPEECWGCASCLKECAHGAIYYYLGADIGGRGGLMQVRSAGDLTHWVITRPGEPPVTITVDRRSANKY
ncbi:MAG: ferredoxin family protein [Oscillospiraceae bacterium]|nr:ferredoxin family protein [Oscillospiraceae bacterium]